MKRALLILASQSLCVLAAGGQAAQQPAAPLQRDTPAQPSRETVQEWFDQEWERAQSMPDFGDCSISWTLEVVYVPPAAELRGLAQSVEGHPDHPKAGLLDAYKRRRNGQFDRVGRRMWVHSNDAWRVNQDFGRGVFDDYTITKRHAWRLTPQTLASSNSTPGKESFERIAGVSKSIWPELTRIMHGGLSFGAISGLEPSPLRLNGNEWRVVISNRQAKHKLQEFELEFIGRWDAAAGRGFVESSTIIKSPRAETIGERTRYIDWIWVEVLSQWVASRVELSNADGRRDRNLFFEEAVCDPEFTFNEVVRLPDETRGDVIRGPIELRRVDNYRTGFMRETRSDGTVITREIPTEASAPSRGWRRLAGVLVMTALAIGFVSLYLKRRSAA